MTLGDIVKNYRADHGLSLREFSRISGVSNGYISMLEKNEHPKTKKPIVPSIEKMRCIANAMGMSFDSLLDMIDSDQPISIKKENAPAPSLTSLESDLLNKYRRLNSEGRKNLSNVPTNYSISVTSKKGTPKKWHKIPLQGN